MSLDPPRRWAAACAVGVAGTALAVALAAPLDARLAAAAAEAPPALVAVGRFATGFGASAYMFAFSALIGLSAVVALGRGQTAWPAGSVRVVAERSLYFFAAVAASGILDQILKHLIGRARPRLLRVEGAFHFEPLSAADVLASFPSGHTTSAFAAAVALGLLRPDRRGWLIAAAAAVGASRVLVGAHYLSDVVGGAALGGAVALALSHAFARRDIAFTALGGRAVAKPLRPAGRRSNA